MPPPNPIQLQPPSPPSRIPTALSLLRSFLAVAIFLLAIAPILFHDTSVHRVERQFEGNLRVPRKDGAAAGGSKSPTITKRVEYYLNESNAFGLDYNDLASPSSNVNIQLPRDIGSAGRALLTHALQPRAIWDEDINYATESQRCAKYFTYENHVTNFTHYNNQTRTTRRRIFLGSLIADDSWHALGALAMESYGIYTAVAFVESNRSQTGTPRELRFVNGTIEHRILVEGGLFGPRTEVHLDQYSYELEVDGGGLIREHRQRNVILDLWRKAGMKEDDIGILSDADETLTRDFLRAIQMCDIPQLNADTQNCHSPKIVVASQVFEGSPECMTVTRKWMHPDLMLGKCIEGIGEEEFRLKERQRQRAFAWRKDEYAAKTNYKSWPKDKKSEYGLIVG